MITNQVPGGSDRFEFSTVQFEGREKVICETVGRVSADAEDGYGETTIESIPSPPNKVFPIPGHARVALQRTVTVKLSLNRHTPLCRN